MWQLFFLSARTRKSISVGRGGSAAAQRRTCLSSVPLMANYIITALNTCTVSALLVAEHQMRLVSPWEDETVF